LLSSCQSQSSTTPELKGASAVDFCEDLSNVSETEKGKRKTFAYVDRSPVPDRLCGNCGLFILKASTQTCGECMLFKGPVKTAGHCIQWAPRS
jgi:hypothetical protein